ncbi:uncharacterized protein [Parasteatoda tepidariorum]|uniref:uncharacterized protein n=1 Tax=Parasteatoda tepidariorum TaxID=114398 RepID=UPI0039BCF48B
MEENNRPRRVNKTRPPYDLRRKVLLKNFLREQMSPIPLQTRIGSLVNNEIPQNSSENEIVDIENFESTSTSNAMNLDVSSDALDPLSSSEISSSSEMEIDDEDSTELEHNRSSPSKSTRTFNFTKITEIKLSRFNSLKRKSPSLSAEAVKVIAGKNSAQLEGKEKHSKNVKAEVPARESKYNAFMSPWKRKPTIEMGKKRGIIKAKNMLQSSKFPFKQQQLDESKSSKLSKVRKMIAVVHNVIKGESPKFKNVSSRESYFKSARQTPPQYENTNFDLRFSSTRSSKYDSFSNGISIDYENEENDSDIPERVRMIKAIKKRQYCGKYNTPHEESFRSRSVLKDPNSFVCKLLRGKTFRRSVGGDSQEQDRSWAHSSDISWSLNEIRKLEKANKRLREENKLLSESLSSVMADVDVALGSSRKRSRPTYNPCQSNISDSHINKQEPKQYHRDVDTPRCKVLRSRSVQDRGERRREIKSRLSSRSMCHQQYSRIPPRTLYRAKPCIINPRPSDEVPLPYPELPPILSVSSDRNCAKPISRRFSMLESMSRKPQVHRRSSFAYESRTYNRHNLLSLPAEAFY